MAFGDVDQGMAAIDGFFADLAEASPEGQIAVAPQERRRAKCSRGGGALPTRGRGSSNQQIASELVLSVRTVERHINHIYAKAGVGNRVEASRYARDHGLIQRIGPHRCVLSASFAVAKIRNRADGGLPSRI